jgi:tyrosinase
MQEEIGMPFASRSKFTYLFFGTGLALSVASLRAQDNDAPTADTLSVVSPSACGTVCTAPLVRKDFNTLGAPAITSLKKGIAAMMALDNGKANNALSPLGWKYQAFIHGTNASVTPKPTGWNTCQHSSWFFLSWHRMELYFFERILRAMSGDATLALPYWNFGPPPAGMDPATFGARLPAAMRVRPTPANPNPLYWQFRNAGLNKAPGATDTATPLSHTDVATLSAFSAPAFFSNIASNGSMTFGGGATAVRAHFSEEAASGRIELAPHNLMHGAVGDGSAQSMSNPDGAGLDPAFWLVHANIDRAWACWEQNHPNDAAPHGGTWLTLTFTFFDVDTSSGTPVAKQVSYTGQQVVDAAAQLGYTYDSVCKDFEVPPAPAPAIRTNSPITELTHKLETGDPPKAPRILVSSPAQSEYLLASEPVTVSIPIPSEDQARIEALVNAGAPAGSIQLTVAGVAMDKTTAAAYGIYPGLPQGATPSDQSDYYAAHLSFFGLSHHHAEEEMHHSMGRDFTYDITDVVRRMVARGQLHDTLTVTFANTAALEPDRAEPPAAPADARARFTYLKLTVQ